MEVFYISEVIHVSFGFIREAELTSMDVRYSKFICISENIITVIY